MSIYVFITVSKGIVSDVKFYENLSEPIQELTRLLMSMDLDNESAAIFSPKGIVLSTGKRSANEEPHNNADRIFRG